MVGAGWVPGLRMEGWARGWFSVQPRLLLLWVRPCRVVASGLVQVTASHHIGDIYRLRPLWARHLQGFGKLGGWTAQILHQEMGAKVGLQCAVGVNVLLLHVF